MFYDDFMRCHEDTVMLCGTASLYGRLVLEVTYGEMIAREEWLGCRHVASPMFDIPGSTPVWA